MEIIYKDKKDISYLEYKISSERKFINGISSIPGSGFFLYSDNYWGMISLLEQYENKIDLVYIDPPFNTNSKFFYHQNRTSTISYGKDDVLAYDDNMEFHTYLEFIRERLVLIHKLLSNEGTLYFHIDIKVGHYIKILLDEIFGRENFINDITRVKSNPKNFKRKAFGNEKDVIFVYSKKEGMNIFNDIKKELSEDEILNRFPKKDKDGRQYTTIPCHAPGETIKGDTGKMWKGLMPPKGRHWRCSPDELTKLDEQGLIEWSKNNVPRIKKFANEHTGKKIQDIWKEFKDPQNPIYPTEKNSDMLDLIIKQSSNRGSIIMDCFCGSGSFLSAGIKNNRIVIGIDKSDAALSVIKNKEELKDINIISI